MRTAILSDIHGNLTALEAVLRDLEDVSPDLIVHAGDLAVNGSSPAEVVDIVRSSGWRGVHGNTDEMLWRPERLSALALAEPARRGRLRERLFNDMAPAAVAALGDERLQWLRGLPARLTIGDLTIVHAAPDNLWRAPLADSSLEQLENTYAPLQSPHVVYGHIHHSFVQRLNRFTVANSGSLSLSYDGDTRASYLVIDGDDWTIRRVSYDLEKEMEALNRNRIPHANWLTEMLRTGRFVPVP